MRTLRVVAIAAALAVAASAEAARADSVLTATLESPFVLSASREKNVLLFGKFDLNFTGAVGSDVSVAVGTFHVLGGSLADSFGGAGGSSPIYGGMQKFVSAVTGTHGINTQPAFGGDIFAEAASYQSQRTIFGGNAAQSIEFDFGYLTIQGPGGAFVGLGSIVPTTGFLYNYLGVPTVNFLLDTVTFSIPDGMGGFATQTGESFDWVARVTTHSVFPPVPEPSSAVLLVASVGGLVAWARRSRRRGPG